MATIWIICGAGKSVGKTTVAQNIADILPNSIYLKQGHGAVKEHKPKNFFHSPEEVQTFIQTYQHEYKHIVIESNTLAKQKISDITIFVDGNIHRTDLRQDREELFHCADIIVHPSADESAWYPQLQKFEADEIRLQRILCILQTQKQYIKNNENHITDPSVKPRDDDTCPAG